MNVQVDIYVSTALSITWRRHCLCNTAAKQVRLTRTPQFLTMAIGWTGCDGIRQADSRHIDMHRVLGKLGRICWHVHVATRAISRGRLQCMYICCKCRPSQPLKLTVCRRYNIQWACENTCSVHMKQCESWIGRRRISSLLSSSASAQY